MGKTTIVRHDLSKRKGCHLGDPSKTPILSFGVRETCGVDSGVASQMVAARGDSPSQAIDELIRISIVEVNGQPVTQPYSQYDRWSARAQHFVFLAWRSLNATDKKEEEDFLKSGEVVEVETGSPGSAPQDG